MAHPLLAVAPRAALALALVPTVAACGAVGPPRDAQRDVGYGER